jgi:DNA-binding beta-propeller fold protein YncE
MKKTTALRLLCAAALTTLAPAAVATDPADLFFTHADGAVAEVDPAGTLINVNFAFNNPRGLAFNAEGNLFIGDNTGGQGRVVMFNTFNSSVSPTLFGNIPGNTFPQGVAIDGTGNVFVVAQDNTSPTVASTIYKFAPTGGTPTVFGSTPGQSFGLTFDSAGNLLVADLLDRTIYQFAPDGTRTVFASGLGAGTPAKPVDLAFDAVGNLFVSMEGTFGVDDSYILEIPAVGSASVFATGLDYSRGLAFDPLGNLFVAELGDNDILKFTPDGTGSVFTFGGPFFGPGPEYVAFGPPGAPNAPDSGMTFVLLGMGVFALFCVRKFAIA